jgi:hypothetical protein
VEEAIASPSTAIKRPPTPSHKKRKKERDFDDVCPIRQAASLEYAELAVAGARH